MIPAFIALGSNIEPRLKYLTAAVDRLKNLGTITKIAPLYQSRAYGVKNQPDFYNSACMLNTKFLPLDLLKALKDIEKEIGRKERFHWGPREIDLDIIFYGDTTINEKELVIPHRDYKNRRFVIQSLANIEPNFIPPNESKNLLQLSEACQDETHLKLQNMNWYNQWK